jgi:putative ABC transport system substrate-binding protein
LASEIVRRHVDVIIATSTPAAYAARLATPTIPIVMGGTLDAQHAGLVTTLSRPEGNVTGLTAISLELVAKRMQLLREVVPRLSRLGFLGRRNSRLGGSVADLERLGETLNAEIDRALDEAGRPLGISVQHIYVREPNEIRDAFADLSRNRAEALYVLESPGLMIERKLIVDLAIRYRLPTICGIRTFSDAGGLMSYGADYTDVYRKVADYVDKLLKGLKPVDLPVAQPAKWELVVNLKTAATLGIAISNSLLLRADEVIQ